MKKYQVTLFDIPLTPITVEAGAVRINHDALEFYRDTHGRDFFRAFAPGVWEEVEEVEE